MYATQRKYLFFLWHPLESGPPNNNVIKIITCHMTQTDFFSEQCSHINPFFPHQIWAICDPKCNTHLISDHATAVRTVILEFVCFFPHTLRVFAHHTSLPSSRSFTTKCQSSLLKLQKAAISYHWCSTLPRSPANRALLLDAFWYSLSVMAALLWDTVM